MTDTLLAETLVVTGVARPADTLLAERLVVTGVARPEVTDTLTESLVVVTGMPYNRIHLKFKTNVTIARYSGMSPTYLNYTVVIHIGKATYFQGHIQYIQCSKILKLT